MNTLLGALCIADVHLNDTTALAVFDDLNVRQRARDAVEQVRETASTPVSAGALRLFENLRKQYGLTGFAIRQQDQAMTMG